MSSACTRKSAPARVNVTRRGRSFEQRGADLRLEITDLLAQGRLGDTEARGGGGEAEMPGDGHEVAKVPEFHIPSYIRKISIETDEIFDV
jgi:hypothetical protein